MSWKHGRVRCLGGNALTARSGIALQLGKEGEEILRGSEEKERLHHKSEVTPPEPLRKVYWGGGDINCLGRGLQLSSKRQKTKRRAGIFGKPERGAERKTNFLGR